MHWNELIHRPLFARRAPLDADNAASRISAYIYGNILVLAALVPIVTGEKYVGILVVLGVALEAGGLRLDGTASARLEALGSAFADALRSERA